MLAEQKHKTLQELIGSSTHEELVWMSGYLEGVIRQVSSADKPVLPSAGKLTIAYGTDTGNSKRLAADFARQAKKSGISAKLCSLDQYRMSDLLKEEYFFVVISTHGDGEPPAAAKKFYEFIHDNTLQLSRLKYSVLALGDTAYPLFCKAGEDVDSRLMSLGASRIYPIQKCDVDFEVNAHEWFDEVMRAIGNSASTPATLVPGKKQSRSIKKNLRGTVLSNINLNGRGSAKKTHHIEILADDVDCEPGDSIGFIPENPTSIVDAVIRLVDIRPDTRIAYRDEEMAVVQLLRKKLNIVYLPERVVRQYAAIVGQEIPATRIDLLNLLKIYPVKSSSQFEEVIGILEPITPRLYSVASSLKAHEGEVHITVARQCFEVNEEIRYGLCSDYLSSLAETESLEFYIHRNSLFRLPAPDADIIMIGPGTGIAPFRAFLEERESTGAMGRNWLFFGDQHFQTDFLYQSDIQRFQDCGVLTNVSVAFSRDQPSKIYVQHKMKEHGNEFFQWIDGGAHLYICGSERPMSRDVEACLAEIVSMHGNLTEEAAVNYVERMKDDGRFHKDVY